MKHILAIFLLLVSSCTMANMIKNPTNRECLQYTLYRESRGESLVTMRAVADVVLNRARKNSVTICETILAKGQFPYARHGIKRVRDRKFLTQYFKVIRMSAIFPDSYIYFNTRKHKWATGHIRIGGLIFSKEKK